MENCNCDSGSEELGNSDNETEICITLKRGKKVLSEFNFGDVDWLLEMPVLKQIFKTATKLGWSSEKLRKALIFFRDVYSTIGNHAKKRRKHEIYTVELFLMDMLKHDRPANARVVLDIFGPILDPNAVSRNSETAIFKAIRIMARDPQNLDIVRRLLELGADLSHRNDMGNEALDVAVAYHDANCVELLLEHGARTHTCKFEGDEMMISYIPPLIRCSEENLTEVAELLICAGCSLDARRYDPLQTPMIVALKQRSMGMVHLFIKCGYNLSLEEFLLPTGQFPEKIIPQHLMRNQSLLAKLGKLASTPTSLKKQMRMFLWRYLSMKRVPVKRVLDLHIPTALIKYILNPSEGPHELDYNLSDTGSSDSDSSGY